MADNRRFPVYVDEETFTEDLEHATPAGRQVAERARSRLETEGIAAGELRACDPEGRDGTRLGGCVKIYLPQPTGCGPPGPHGPGATTTRPPGYRESTSGPLRV